MRYFKLIRSDVDVARLLEEVQFQPQAWLIDTARQDKIPAQRETNTIFLRSAVSRPDLHINENQQSHLTSASKRFPKALAFMTEFAEAMGCQLSRATIVRLKPKSQVFRHIDEGSYYFLRDRFHLVLSVFTRSFLSVLRGSGASSDHLLDEISSEVEQKMKELGQDIDSRPFMPPKSQLNSVISLARQ